MLVVTFARLRPAVLRQCCTVSTECDRTGLHYLEGDPGTDTDDQVVSSQCHHADPSMCAWPMVLAGVPYWPVNSPGDGMVSNGEMDSCASGL